MRDAVSCASLQQGSCCSKISQQEEVDKEGRSHLSFREAVVAAGPRRGMGFAEHDPLAAVPCWRVCYKLSQQIVRQLLWKHILHQLAGHLLLQLLMAYRHLLAALSPVCGTPLRDFFTAVWQAPWQASALLLHASQENGAHNPNYKCAMRVLPAWYEYERFLYYGLLPPVSTLGLLCVLWCTSYAGSSSA